MIVLGVPEDVLSGACSCTCCNAGGIKLDTGGFSIGWCREEADEDLQYIYEYMPEKVSVIGVYSLYEERNIRNTVQSSWTKQFNAHFDRVSAALSLLYGGKDASWSYHRYTEVDFDEETYDMPIGYLDVPKQWLRHHAVSSFLFQTVRLFCSFLNHVDADPYTMKLDQHRILHSKGDADFNNSAIYLFKPFYLFPYGRNTYWQFYYLLTRAHEDKAAVLEVLDSVDTGEYNGFRTFLLAYTNHEEQPFVLPEFPSKLVSSLTFGE